MKQLSAGTILEETLLAELAFGEGEVLREIQGI